MKPSQDDGLDFAHFLESAGFKRVRDEAPANAMGNRFIEFAGSGLCIQLVWEKGYWDLRIADIEVPDVWYDLRVFTYVLPGSPQPKMPFKDQVEYAKAHWPEIVGTFRSDDRAVIHTRLNAAKMELARKVSAVWPTAITDLGSFLEKHGLNCIYKKEPRFLYDSMSVCYANSIIAVRMDSRDGWHIYFANAARDPDRWYRFNSVRRSIQWPNDVMLGYVQAFPFIKEHWTEIVNIFAAEDSDVLRQRLDDFDNAALTQTTE